jgi:hypothetical protein
VTVQGELQRCDKTWIRGDKMGVRRGCDASGSATGRRVGVRHEDV